MEAKTQLDTSYTFPGPMPDNASPKKHNLLVSMDI